MTEEQRQTKNANIAAAVRETKLKRASQVCRVYTIKIDESRLSKLQKEQLKMIFVEAKWIWNECISYGKQNDIFKYVTGKQVIHKDKDMNDIVSDLNYIGSQMKQDIVRQIHDNIKALSRSKIAGNKIGLIGYTKEIKSINLKQYKTTYQFKDAKMTKIKVQGVKGTMTVRGSKQFRNIEGLEFANAKIINRPDGYYLAIVTYIDKSKVEPRKLKQGKLGIDFGCSTFFTTSEGEKINAIVQESDRLKKLQHKLARQNKGSKGRAKTISLIRKEYQRMSNKKLDLANKIAYHLSEYETVVIQDEQIASWHKKGHGKKVQHSVLGLVKAKLKAKTNVTVLSKWESTTKLCNICGTKNESLTLRDRTFVCPNCGHKENRDIHAAKNMIYLYDRIVGNPRLKIVGMGRTEVTHGETKSSTYKETCKQDLSRSHEDTTL